jgi:hypothetical protein
MRVVRFSLDNRKKSDYLFVILHIIVKFTLDNRKKTDYHTK